MIDSDGAVKLLEQLQQQMVGDHLDIDAEVFWRKLSWDPAVVFAIAEAGEAVGMGDPVRSMVQMQMGAIMALAGMQQKQPEGPQPFDHLKVS